MIGDVLFYGVVIGIAAMSGIGLGVSAMLIIYGVTSNSVWRRLRHHYRPFLWYLGMDWPEIKRTYKRAFMLYYGRSLPESQPLMQPSESSDGGLLDESGDVPPGASLPMSAQTEAP
jgi:hypothetical protein